MELLAGYSLGMAGRLTFPVCALNHHCHRKWTEMDICPMVLNFMIFMKTRTAHLPKRLYRTVRPFGLQWWCWAARWEK